MQSQLNPGSDSLRVDVYYREDFTRSCFQNNVDRLYLIPMIMERLDDEKVVQHIESQVGRKDEFKFDVE